MAALLLHANWGGVFLALYGAVLGEAPGLQASTALNQADFAPLESSGGDSSTCWRAFRQALALCRKAAYIASSAAAADDSTIKAKVGKHIATSNTRSGARRRRRLLQATGWPASAR